MSTKSGQLHIDLMAIVPFVLSAGAIHARVIRIARLLRVLRILKLTRCSRAMERFGKATALAKEEIVQFLAVTMMLLYLSAFGIYHFEHSVQPEAFPSIVHSLWWAAATLTTVGYGDVYPVTAGGKLFTFVMLMCGLGIVAVPAGLVATALSKVHLDEDRMESGSGEPTPRQVCLEDELTGSTTTSCDTPSVSIQPVSEPARRSTSQMPRSVGKISV